MTREELRAAVLAADDITILAVPTPEWPLVNGLIHVRVLSGLQRERYLQSIRRVVGEGETQTIAVDQEDSQLKLALATVCDARGALLFTEPGDLEALGNKSSLALERIVDATSDLNGFSARAVASAKNAYASGTAIAASSTV